MQEFDRIATKKLKIPGIVLMENAGAGVFRMIQRHFGSVAGRTFAVLCGKGSNGGDGFVAARHLFNHGGRVLVVLVGKRTDLKRDARANYECIRRMEARLEKGGRLKIKEVKSGQGLRMLPEAEYLIDALFGTGFSGNVKGIYGQAIEWINGRRSTKISVDLPSGVDANNGEIGNVAVRADLTVTMGLKKIGLVTGKGRGYVGTLEAVDLGIDGVLAPKGSTFLVNSIDVRRVLPRRPLDAHKHSVGKILILAGSRGLTGAAAMTSASAMRAGAGAVILCTPQSVYPILARKLTEVMVEPMPETPDGSLSLDAYQAARKHFQWADVLIIGPGLSRIEETQRLVWKVVTEFGKPMVIDADALNALAEKVSLLKRRKNPDIIVTPHTGELSRLSGMPAQEIERERVSVARLLAKQLHVTLILKGAPTVTASETGLVLVNPTGNPGMATAGAGDVLAGVVGALWAQGMGRTDAAFAGVFVHGYAGDRAKNELGERGLMATDIARHIPASILEIEGAA